MHLAAATAAEKSAPPPHLGSPSHTLTFADAYRHVFEGVPANTPQLLQAAHRLRYQVFCVENKIFDPADNPGGLERDEYDNHSLQAVLLHRATQAIVGTIRLVLHKPGARHGSLPFHRVCNHPQLRDPTFLPLESTAEVGRFAISKAFRHQLSNRVDGGLSALSEAIAGSRRLLPYITLGLITAALLMGLPLRIRHVCAVMEPALLRLLGRMGFRFEPLGPPVEYYGLRQPCYATVAQLLARFELERRELWETATDFGRLIGSALSSEQVASRDAL
jgi:N-acyl amino acid synthase of PEP-CTERM/exosortase system